MIDLTDVPIVDNPVHPWRESVKRVDASELVGHVTFSECVVTSVREEYLPIEQLEEPLRLFRQTSLSSRYFLVELAKLLDVEENWDAIAEARNRHSEPDLRGWSERLFRSAGVNTLMVDEGGSRPRITLDELGAIAPARLRRVARSDNFIRDLLPQEESWSGFFNRFQEELQAAIDDGAMAFKTVIAYRTGLDIQQVSEADARSNFESSRTAPELEQKPLRDFLVCHTMDVARANGLWTHIHAATGDPDIQFQRSNPGQLYPLLHSKRFRGNKVVLIHGGWPWVSEAAAMVGILPNVYLDVSEGSIFGMGNLRQRIMEAFEFCPYAKILYSSDASTPETLWAVARRYKSALGRVLAELTAEGFFSPREAYQAGQMIMGGNAARLYGLDLP